MQANHMNTIDNSGARAQRLQALLATDPDNLSLLRECLELAMSGGAYDRA